MELPSWVPGPLRDPRRALPAAAVVIALIAAAIYIPSRSSDPKDTTSIVGDQSAATDDDKQAYAAAKGDDADNDDAGAASPGSRSSAEVTSDGELPAGVGGKKPSRAIDRNSYTGVTDKEIKLVVSYQHDPCGQDPEAIIQQALPAPDPEGSIAAALKWFSNPKRALAGDLPKDVLDHLGTGYYGRTVKHVITDDRGDFCPEQSREDAKSAISAHKPFAIIGGGNEWDDVAVGAKTLKVTGRPATDAFFKERRPYLWGPITGATTNSRFLAGYTKSRLYNKKSVNTGDVRTASKTRVLGVIHMDQPEINRVKDEFLAMLKSRGVSVKSRAVVGYEPKLSTIAVQARNIVAQLMTEGVTTILMLMDPIAVQFISQAADQQSWRPEWITNTLGLMDWSLGPRTFMSREQALNTFGISVFWPSKQIREKDTEEYKAWKAINPGEDVPSDWLSWYRSFKVFFRGLAVAGPELTPSSVEAGYHALCAPCRRVASYMPLTGYGPGDYTAVDDAHLQRYDPDAPDYAAAEESWENGQPPKGAYVYENGGKRYTTLG